MPSVLVCLCPISSLFSTQLTTTTLTFKAELAQRYQSDGMLAYVETVQRKEKEIGCDVLTHQKWCASVFSIILLIISPHFTFSFAGVERIILIEFCPRSHLGRRAPLRGGMILPNTRSSRILFVLRFTCRRSPES